MQILKKRIISLFVIILFIASCKDEKKISIQTEPSIQKTIEHIQIPEKLIGYWVPEFNDFGWQLEFEAQENYKEFYSGEGCGGYTGKYVQTGNIIKLLPEDKPECFREERRNNKICQIQPAVNSLYSNWKLVCNNLEELFSKEYEKKDGEILYINSQKVSAVYPKVFYTQTETFFREEPSKNSNSITCWTEIAGDGIKSETLFENTMLNVIARTLDKHKVGKTENYWYYVKPYTGWYSSGCKKSFGWVYGEYIGRKRTDD